MSDTIRIDETQVQGIVKRGYAKLPGSAIFIISFGNDIVAVRQWLAQALPRITRAAESPADRALQVAFSYSGLKRLGGEFEGLSHEFMRGPATEEAGRILGDLEASASDRWLWGGPRTPQVDAVAIAYGLADNIDAICQEELKLMETLGLNCQLNVVSKAIDQHEPFGFRDGISQPFMRGFGGTSS